MLFNLGIKDNFREDSWNGAPPLAANPGLLEAKQILQSYWGLVKGYLIISQSNANYTCK